MILFTFRIIYWFGTNYQNDDVDTFRDIYDFLKWNLYCVGLDAAGKTTVLYRMKMGETVTTIPTIGKKTFLQKTF